MKTPTSQNLSPVIRDSTPAVVPSRNVKEFHVVTILRSWGSSNHNQHNLSLETVLLPRRRQQQQRDTSTSRSVLYTTHWEWKDDNNSNNNDVDDFLAWMETVAWMSHVVVWHVSAGHKFPSAIIIMMKALQRGFQRRQQQPTKKNKAQFLVVLDRCEESCSKDYSDLEEWRSDFVLHHLSQIEPGRHVQTFDIGALTKENPDIWSLSNLQNLLLPFEEEEEDWDLPVEGFPLLLQKISQSILLANKTVLSQTPPPRKNTNTNMTNSLDDNEQASSKSFVNTENEEHEEKHLGFIDDDDEKCQEILSWATDQMNDLRSRQEDSWLNMNENNINNYTSNNNNNLFGTLATAFLDELFVQLKYIPQKSMRIHIQDQVGTQLRQLYQQHLQYVRNHLGTLYEQILDQQAVLNDDDNQIDPTPQLQAAMVQITQQFRQSAMQAIPILAQPGGVFRDMDLEYAYELQGLCKDMLASNELWTLDHSSQALLQDNNNHQNDYDHDQKQHRVRPKRNKWYHKLGARLITLGVNYLQGWLAWQGIQRAALEREKQLPKFPIF